MELAATLAQLHAALAQASTPAELLQATLPYLGPLQPQAVALHYLPTLAEGRGDALYLAAQWPGPALPAESSALAAYLTLATLTTRPADVLLIPQLDQDAALPADLRDHLIS